MQKQKQRDGPSTHFSGGHKLVGGVDLRPWHLRDLAFTLQTMHLWLEWFRSPARPKGGTISLACIVRFPRLFAAVLRWPDHVNSQRTTRMQPTVEARSPNAIEWPTHLVIFVPCVGFVLVESVARCPPAEWCVLLYKEGECAPCERNGGPLISCVETQA